MDPRPGPPTADLLIGQTIGNYLVTQKLGEGGMGSVYLAEHPTIGKKVALKVLHSEFSSNQEVAARFFNEAKAVNDIGHPNIVDVVDFGIIQAGAGRENLVYFIMEYLAGSTLAALIRSEAPLPPERALAIALQVADALAASHRCGIVHRDLKPDNIILITRGRERDFVKLLDFGIAKLTGDSLGSHRTRTGIVMGTPAYMSPEQCEGRGSVDLRTDIYALGILLYEMLTGRVPFIGEGYGEILVQHLTQYPAPPSQYRMLPPHVEVVVMKALEKRADLRYPTMDEMMHALSDPVGYVEAHGGIAGFMQQQLMPSTAALPPMRPTPMPLTPAPGSLTAPAYGTPAPTTLGAAVGELQPRRRKMGFLLAGLLIVAGAAIGVAVVLTTSAGTSQPAASGDSHVAVAPPAAPIGSAMSATVTPIGSGSAAASATPIESPGVAGARSDAERRGELIEPTTVVVHLTSTPPGAEIFVNGVDTGHTTDFDLVLPRQAGGQATVLLRLAKYKELVIPNVSLAAPSQQHADLDKLAAHVHSTGHTGSGRRPASTSNDPDGLMRPD